MAKYKKQHYVPRFILKNFSKDKKRISFCIINSGKIIQGASIANQCYRDYYYGKDGFVEVAFSHAESEFKTAVGNLELHDLENLGTHQLYLLRLYSLYQRSRTLAAAKSLNDYVDFVSKLVISFDLEAKNIDPAEYKVGYNDPQYQALYLAASSQPLILDLDVKFLYHESACGLVLSDNPVVQHNQWAEHHPLFRKLTGSHGLALKGLQWFFPLSPIVCLAVYDPGVYAYGSGAKKICKISKKDVQLLNAMQSASAFNCVYFDSKMTSEEDISQLLEKRKILVATKRRRKYIGPAEQLPDGKTKHLIGILNQEIKYSQKFSFIKIIDDDLHDGCTAERLPIRSHELYELTKLWQKEMDELSVPAEKYSEPSLSSERD